MKQGREPRVLLTGATGYVGGRLLRTLEKRGVPVRCLARKPEHLSSRTAEATQVVQGDCLDAATLAPALSGIDIAFYLVHSLGATDFEELDRKAAVNFGNAAREAGVRRIIFLGGLGSSGDGLSKHLRSRQETGDALRACGVPVIEFRASIILGSGSLSFEMIRALVERLPIMICPSWVNKQAQPINVKDVIAYLVAGMDLPGEDGRVYEIGGADQVSYREIMVEYAKQRGLRRLMIPVPLLSPYVSSLWLGLTTPVYARVGRKLIGSIRNSTVVQDDSALQDFDIRPVGLEKAIRRAMAHEEHQLATNRWSDSISSAGVVKSWGGVQFGTRLVDSRSRFVAAKPSQAFAPIRRIGGSTGWYHANFLWKLRGILDVLVGGVGMRRGRPDADRIFVGDTLDCWRVEAFEPGRLLRLSAEMKLPGRAWLEFEVKPTPGGSIVHQTAVFDPVGLFGQLYWYGIFPLHGWVFSGMLREITDRATQEIEETIEPSQPAA